MAPKTRATRSKKSKRRPSRRTQSGGNGQEFGYNIAYPNVENRDRAGRAEYVIEYLPQETARRERLKTPGAKPKHGEPCTPLFGPRSECDDYPRVKCSTESYFVPGTTTKVVGYHSPGLAATSRPLEHRCIDQERIKLVDTQSYADSGFYSPSRWEVDPIISHRMATKSNPNERSGGKQY
jgi:hypothetical protein